jgi:hypothetical protein
MIELRSPCDSLGLLGYIGRLLSLKALRAAQRRRSQQRWI